MMKHWLVVPTGPNAKVTFNNVVRSEEWDPSKKVWHPSPLGPITLPVQVIGELTSAVDVVVDYGPGDPPPPPIGPLPAAKY
jgi:hypothetical protein